VEQRSLHTAVTRSQSTSDTAQSDMQLMPSHQLLKLQAADGTSPLHATTRQCNTSKLVARLLTSGIIIIIKLPDQAF
jgi:hypothetical protein